MKKFLFFLLVAIVFVTDFYTKLWVVDHLQSSIMVTYPYGGLGVIRDFLGMSFSIVYEVNRGAILGIFSNYQTALLLLRIGFCLFLIYYSLKRNRTLFESIALGLIVGGAIGNIVDIFVYGQVIDMLKFVFGSFHYPVFNLADSAITVGAITYFLAQFEKKSYAKAA